MLPQEERESTVIACRRETGVGISLSPESTESPRPLLVQQDTISNTYGMATFHMKVHDQIDVTLQR